jgi:dolichol kinase
MMSFTDSRDSGVLLVSHFSLLTGCAGPVWLVSVYDTEGAACLRVPIAAFSGIMSLGIADSAASAIGVRFGRNPIFRGVHPPPQKKPQGAC